MAIVPMADAVPGAVASSAEYNKLIDNIQDLDARIGSIEDIFAKYYRTTDQSNGIVNNTWTKTAFNVSIETHAQVTPDAGFDDWTINKAGIWEIHASVRCGTTNVDPMLYRLGIFPSSGIDESTCYAVKSLLSPSSSAFPVNMDVYTKRRFTAGTQLCVAVNRINYTGGAGGNNASVGGLGEITQISFSYVGP